LKVKDLIEQLKGYEDFEVTTTISEQPYAGARIQYYTYKITGVGDIGHSDKVVDLDNWLLSE
jgi:hypothetical protein